MLSTNRLRFCGLWYLHQDRLCTRYSGIRRVFDSFSISSDSQCDTLVYRNTTWYHQPELITSPTGHIRLAFVVHLRDLAGDGPVDLGAQP